MIRTSNFAIETFLADILPRAQQREDLLISVHVPSKLDPLSVRQSSHVTFTRVHDIDVLCYTSMAASVANHRKAKVCSFGITRPIKTSD